MSEQNKVTEQTKKIKNPFSGPVFSPKGNFNFKYEPLNRKKKPTSTPAPTTGDGDSSGSDKVEPKDSEPRNISKDADPFTPAQTPTGVPTIPGTSTGTPKSDPKKDIKSKTPIGDPATDEETLDWVYGDLSMPRGDDACWEDLNANMWWYGGMGAFFAMTVWPIVKIGRRPLQFWNYGTEARNFIRYTSQIRASVKAAPASEKFVKALQPLVDISKRVLGYMSGIFMGAPKGLATTVKGLWTTGRQGIVGTLTSAIGPDKTSRLGTSLAGGAGGAVDVIKGGFVTFKGIGTALVAIAILAHLFRGGDDSDEAQKIKKIEDWEGLINGVIDGTLLSEAAMEVMLIGIVKGINSDFSEKCFWENTLRATAILLIYYGATATGNPTTAREFSGLADYRKSLTRATTPDEVVLATKAFHRNQIDELTAGLQRTLPKVIDETQSGFKNIIRAKVNPAQQTEYVRVLLEQGPKAANKYLQSLGINDKVRKQIHSACVNRANAASKAFVKDYKDLIIGLEAQTGARTKLRARADQMKSVNNKTLRQLEQALVKADKGTAASAKLLSAAKLSKKNGLDLASKGVRGDLKTLKKLSNELDVILYAGGDPLKIVKIYRNNMIPLLNRNANNLDNLIRSQLTGSVRRLNTLDSSKIAMSYVQQLSAINKASKRSGFFEEMVKATGSKNLGMSLFRGKESKLVNAQLSAREITSILSGQVLKANKNLRPKDVVRLEKQLLIFHKNVNTAVTKVWKIPGFDVVYGKNQFLLNSAVTVAITSSIIAYLFSQLSVSNVEIEDIDNWRSCNLVKALIWEEYGNGFMASVTKKVLGKEKIFVPQYAIDSESESIKTLYEYLYKPEFKPIMSKFLNEYLFNSAYLENEALLPKAVLQKFFEGKDAEDFDEEFRRKVVQDIADSVTSKKGLQSLLEAWGNTKGSDRVADRTDTESMNKYRNKYFPIFIKLLVYNSSIYDQLTKYYEIPQWRDYYNQQNADGRIELLLGTSAKGRAASIYIYDYSRYKSLGEECVEKEIKRKTLFSVRETQAALSTGETLNYTSVGEVLPWKELFWNRILYALKPGEFYGSQEESAVNQVSDEQAKQIGAERQAASKKPKEVPGSDNSQYKDLDFSKKKHLSMLECYKLLKKHQPTRMRDKYTEEDIYVLAAIGGADALESSGNARAFNPRVSGKDWSYGIWQINMHGSLGPGRRKKYNIKNKDLFNPEINAKVAWDLFLDGVQTAEKIKQDPGYINRMGPKKRERFAPLGDANKFGHWSVAIKTRKGGVKYKKLMAAAKRLKKQVESEVNTMKETNLKDLVSNLIKEDYGKGYTPYPYHSHIGQENEPAEDFVQDWKDFELSLVRDESRDTAIRVAKVLIRDLELFGDVLDLVGKNQSVATEILKYLRKDEENS